jgi:hypothetical protein
MLPRTCRGIEDCRLQLDDTAAKLEEGTRCKKIIWLLKKREVQRAISDCSVHENAEIHTTSNILVLFISLILSHNSITINLASGAFEDFQDPVEGS